MPGLIFVSPGAFDSPDGLPTVPVRQVTPIPGATMDWAADRLPNGSVSEWTDMVGGYVFKAPDNAARHPAAVNGVLQFDGTTDYTEIDGLPGTQPKTVVLVGRARSANANFFTGGEGSKFDFAMWQSNWTFSAGTTFKTTVPGDTNWHVFIIVANGGSSIVSIDGNEQAGSAGTNPGATLRLAASATATYPVDIRRLAILPHAATSAERASIYSTISRHYNI